MKRRLPSHGFKNQILFFLIIMFTATYAQIPDSRQQMLTKFSEMEIHRYKQLYTAERMQSANQESYDVKYYSLDLVPDPSEKNLSGTAEIICKVTSPSLDSLDLNFWEGMNITDIHLSNSPDIQLNYHRNSDILSILLGAVFQQGEQIAITIKYQGTPQNSGYDSFIFENYNGKPMIWTLSEPYGARAWWPCKDVPSDKADSVDIRVTVPGEFIVASNGSLKQTDEQGDMTTYWWHEQYPVSTYLVFLAIYPYTVYYDDYLYNQNTDTMKIHFYMFPDHYDHLYASLGKTKDMIKCYSNLFGEYPFIKEKYGQAEIYNFSAVAMEHQTCTSIDYSYNFNDPFWTEWVISHELAHQWWGDLITCADFQHVWLNEGFATYSSALWYEYLDGPGAESDYMNDIALYRGPGTVFVEDPTDMETIFIYELTYLKAAWVMHMLRHALTDTSFFESLRTYASSAKTRFGSATTDDFREICEQVADMDLHRFFQQWIYEEYYPYYSYGWSVRPGPGGYSVKLRIDQIQQEKIRNDLNLFWMPVDVKIYLGNADTTYVVLDSLKSQTFELYVDNMPTNVELDPGGWILKQTQNDSLLPSPFGETVYVNDLYQAPGSDTVQINSQVNNPDGDDPDLTAIIESVDKTFSDSVHLSDDGSHYDGSPGDGLFGGLWAVPEDEREYRVNVKTVSLNSQYYNISNACARFTTIGPIVLDHYQITSDDTIPNHGDYLRFAFTLRNKGLASAAENITSVLKCLDSNATIQILSEINYGNIEPGMAVAGGSRQYIRFNQNSPDSVYATFRLDISSNHFRFWSNTFSVFLTKDLTALAHDLSGHPLAFSLSQNYPNPFNPSTTIEFTLPHPEYTTLKIYNILGAEVATLVSDKLQPGLHRYIFEGSGLASGVFYYMITAGEFREVKKMILIR